MPLQQFLTSGQPDGTDATNTYASGYLGRRLGEDWAVGIGASIAGLNAVDGVDLLYAGSQWIEQDGSAWDVRAGVTGGLGGKLPGLM